MKCRVGQASGESDPESCETPRMRESLPAGNVVIVIVIVIVCGTTRST
jgi:hypothetical protein